jgi:hypothetical protein
MHRKEKSIWRYVQDLRGLFLYPKTGCRFEKASFLTGRCRKGRAYQDAGKRQALCQISMIFDLSQIKSTKTTNRRNNHGRKKIHILRQIPEGEIR